MEGFGGPRRGSRGICLEKPLLQAGQKEPRYLQRRWKGKGLTWGRFWGGARDLASNSCTHQE